MNREEYKRIYNYLKTGKHSQMDNDYQKNQLESKSNKYLIRHHQLYHQPKYGEPQRVIQPEQVELVIFSLHSTPESAHLGIETTYQKVKERYYWPNMKKVIEEYVRTCDICQKRGRPFRRETHIPISVKGPFQRIGIDIKGPLRETERGKRYIIVAMDYLTKWPEAQATKDAKTTTVAEFIYQKIICQHECSEIILSDRRTAFTS